MQSVIKENVQEVLVQYGKAILIVALLCLLFIGRAHASDSTGISDLDTQATAFQQGVKVFAKWGGILLVVITGVIIGTGKAQGQVANYLAYAAIALGCILAAWGWFANSFSSGFVF